MEVKRKQKPLIAVVPEDKYMSGQVSRAIVPATFEDRGISVGKQLILVASRDPRVIADSVLDIVEIESVCKLISAKTPYSREVVLFVGGKQLTEQQVNALVEALGYYSDIDLLKYTPLAYIVSWKQSKKEAAV